jgi:hypothetical protein
MLASLLLGEESISQLGGQRPPMARRNQQLALMPPNNAHFSMCIPLCKDDEGGEEKPSGSRI